MPTQREMDRLYLGMASSVARMSRAARTKVGAVLVKGKNILSYGWNGTPSGFDNVCEYKEYMDRGAGGWLSPEEIEERWPHEQEMKYGEWAGTNVRYRLVTKPEVLHAESNVLMKLLASDNPVSTTGSTLYLTMSPCFECAKLIKQAGIIRIVYINNYRITNSLDFLKQVGIEVEKWQED
jgi:dCMP deaminase